MNPRILPFCLIHLLCCFLCFSSDTCDVFLGLNTRSCFLLCNFLIVSFSWPSSDPCQQQRDLVISLSSELRRCPSLSLGFRSVSGRNCGMLLTSHFPGMVGGPASLVMHAAFCWLAPPFRLHWAVCQLSEFVKAVDESVLLRCFGVQSSKLLRFGFISRFETATLAFKDTIFLFYLGPPPMLCYRRGDTACFWGCVAVTWLEMDADLTAACTPSHPPWPRICCKLRLLKKWCCFCILYFEFSTQPFLWRTDPPKLAWTPSHTEMDFCLTSERDELVTVPWKHTFLRHPWQNIGILNTRCRQIS